MTENCLDQNEFIWQRNYVRTTLFMNLRKQSPLTTDYKKPSDMYEVLGRDSYPQLTTEHTCINEVHKRRVFAFREPCHKSKIVLKLLNPSTYVILEELDCKYVAKLYERVLS